MALTVLLVPYYREHELEPTSDQRQNHQKMFKYFDLKSNARIWLRLSYMCVIDSGLVGSSGVGYKARRCRRVTYPESYITKYTTYTKIITECMSSSE